MAVDHLNGASFNSLRRCTALDYLSKEKQWAFEAHTNLSFEVSQGRLSGTMAADCMI